MMLRTAFAALAGVSMLALAVSDSLAQPQTQAPRARMQERPAPTEPSRTSVPDEPLQQSGPVVERNSARGSAASERKISDFDIATAPINEVAKVTHHSINLGGKAIAYTATAGTLTIRDDEGKPIASMFYVAYTADGERASTRPVTFLYNGGPGSASMWLHMGSFAPVRVHTNAPTPTPNAPFTVTPNPDSLLDKTDLVFLDAIGAGYSRPLGDTKGAAFWGVDEDIDAFARGITRYVTINHRWNSPKFLFGESYGTTRSAGLVYALQQQGMQFNGVMLLSSILNYGVRNAGFDNVYVTYLPSYASTAAYHHKIPTPADLPAFLNEVRAWARGPYAAALAKGDTISDAELDAVARQMSAYTGISATFLKEVNLRLDLSRFRKELLRDQRLTIGRYDSRFTGYDADAGGESPETDPSDTAVSGAFIGALHDYLERDLGYVTNMAYRPSADGANRAWDWKHKAPGQRFGTEREPDTAQDLGAAIRNNPHLKVLSLNGVYDMATPFFGTEYDLHHMWLDKPLRGNVEFAYYPSGHMVYLNPQALTQMKADVARFYDEQTAR